MTHELILTSVAKGLDPNDRGFCPVAADAAMVSRVWQQLLTLHNYQRLIGAAGNSTAENTTANSNPVMYSHLALPGGIEHVLSRVALTGLDYRQQPNVLAHHIVLEELEFVPEGPAWLLALPGFHLTEWHEPPLRFPQGRPIPTLTNPQSLTRRQQIARQRRWLDPMRMALTGSVDTTSEQYLTAVRKNEELIAHVSPPTSPCPTWEELTGDPGWGGVLAETAVTGQPVVLIYNPEHHILPLFVEALALLPPHFSWQTTFNTYFTEVSNPLPCQWKGVIAGSEEAKKLINDSDHLILQLSEPMNNSPEGKYVDYARHGQEHALPFDIEADGDTKPHAEETKEIIPSDLSSNPASNKIYLSTPSIQLPKKQAGLLDSFLHRSSRSQFYLLYSIMFALVLFLLILAVDQVSELGILQTAQNWNQPAKQAPLNNPELHNPPFNTPELHNPEHQIETTQEAHGTSELEQAESIVPIEPEKDTQKIFEEHREKQRLPLLLFWESFAPPEFLAINVPDIHDDHIDIPEKTTWNELSPFHPFGAALELQFTPLFELPHTQIATSLVVDTLPNVTWRVEAIDIETHRMTPIFLFQLTESGLEMNWQPEGLHNQHLYDTILSSLGFLQLNVADVPEQTIQIPLFTPTRAEPVNISDLVRLAESETPEHAMKSPFASELWQRIFAETNPPKTILLEVQPEPAGDWIQIKPSQLSEFHAEIHTSQQIGKPTENNETLFENIGVQLTAEASLEKIVWKGDEYAERLRQEQTDATLRRNNLTHQIDQLQMKAFEGDTNARGERDQYIAERETVDRRLREIENILDKLPEAYKEIGQNKTNRLRYSVFLQSASGDHKLLILTTEH